MDSLGACPQCTDGEEDNVLPASVAPIGEHVVTGGHYRTRHAFGQCRVCGSLWVTVTDADSDLALHRRLTDDLF